MNVVVLTGAGISAESGLKTFRNNDGLWENFSIEEVCSAQGWAADRKKVLDFYNARRRQVREAKPNAGHRALVELEKKHSVQIITQNIDDLHERAGSTQVLHLHGEIVKARSSLDPELTVPCPGNIAIGQRCPQGSQLRPHVVFFGEEVPQLPAAARLVARAELLLVVGTSLVVYPAAGLVQYASPTCLTYLIDPNPPVLPPSLQARVLKGSASDQLPILVKSL